MKILARETACRRAASVLVCPPSLNRNLRAANFASFGAPVDRYGLHKAETKIPLKIDVLLLSVIARMLAQRDRMRLLSLFL
jgi:hypothetical protein